MSLRRSAMTRRRTELRRTPFQHRVQDVAARTRKTIATRRKDTGPTAGQRRLVAERAGYCCELCGRLLHDGTQWTQFHSFHHRAARQMGGTRRPEINSPCNLLLTCGTGTTGCHGDIESNRTSSYAAGWLVKAGTDPATVKVAVHRFLFPVLLTADGGYLEVTV